jgi:thioredoxin-like negative regulator of GroEL
MSITRLNLAALERIIDGRVKEDVTCVVKFYSTGCHLCHALQTYYASIAKEDQYSDLHFFAFNVDDHPSIEKRLKFDGVPTISVIQSKKAPRKSTVRIMPEPDHPNQKTWYKVSDIKTFIEKES